MLCFRGRLVRLIFAISPMGNGAFPMPLLIVCRYLQSPNTGDGSYLCNRLLRVSELILPRNPIFGKVRFVLTPLGRSAEIAIGHAIVRAYVNPMGGGTHWSLPRTQERSSRHVTYLRREADGFTIFRYFVRIIRTVLPHHNGGRDAKMTCAWPKEGKLP